jgi:hypothetical protein
MSFFSDFQKLKQKTVHLGLRGFKNIGCDYNDYLYFSKVCYMCFDADYFENCMHCVEGKKLKHSCDCTTCEGCELCYGCLDCQECWDGTYLQDCRRVSQSLFCYDCIGCNNCFGCAGLRQKNYYLFNKRLDEEEYKKKVQEWKMKGIDAILAEFEKVKESIPHQWSMFYRTEDCTGDHIANGQRSVECFNSQNLQDCGYMNRVYVVYGLKNTDSYDAYFSVDLEYSYEMAFVGKGYNSSFCFYCEVVRDCDYCFQVFNSKSCFGCVGLNHGENMILNQKYSPEDYEKKKAEIIEQMKKDGEWGCWPMPEGERYDTG